MARRDCTVFLNLSVLAQVGNIDIMNTKQYPRATQKQSGTDLDDFLLLCSFPSVQTVPG